MGVGRRKLALLWALGLTLACAQHTGQAQDSTAELGYAYPDLPPAPQGPGGNSLRGVTIHPPLRSTPLVRALNAAHRGRVCSTWGDFHYKTFDGDVFRFPGLCNYVFSAHCGAAYEDFNLQLRRGPGPNATAPSRVTMKLDGMVVELTKGSVLVNSLPIQLPFSRSGVLIEQRSSGVKVAARLGLVFMWNQDDSLLLELDPKYANQTCGLCGDFNGVPVFNEFFSHNIKLTATEFGNLQKMDGPTEQCQDPAPEPPVNCLTGFGICEEMLSSEPFLDCAALVDASSYVETCRQDLCHCGQANLTSCLCHTLAEYSRQCTHAGGLPLDWRGPQLCPQTCPLNMQYRECGSPCVDTCSNLEHSQLCEDHCVAGCFCPEGTVLDDVGHTGCIPVPQCSCVYNGATYTPGTGYSTDCTNCTCAGGRWRCQEVQCPGTCSVLGGAHFSTFDERQYTVHGDCSYVLAKPCDSSAFTVLAELRRCGLTDSETCLKSLTLTLGGGHMVFVVKASGAVFVNQIYTQLPLSAANVTLFRPSTFFIIAQTQLGLQLDIQLVPVMQVFVRLAPQLQGQTCGLCGNFNQNQADDFQTISGMVEGTAAAFANTWKTQAACPNVKNSLEDPCSLSVENEKYAQHWCSRLTDPRGPFTRCHAAVSPSAYYSNCMFDTCNCEKSEDCMCAALSSYVRACAARGVLLGGWRDGMCTKAMTTCPQSLTYLYNISTCQPTCRARSDADVTCSISFVPVDGCTCPDGTFLDDTDQCVLATSCPCYHGGSVVPNGESTHEQGVVCTCTQGTLTCIGGHAPAPVCTPPMVYFDCHNTTPGAAGAGCQKSCHTLDMDCYSSQCVPGCVCPHGLVATGDGGCIPVSDCPCVHNEASYKPGQTIRVGCNTCTCKSRMWQCTDQPCPATCAVYGDGHYRTFDGQRYSFSGDCEYTLLQDHCGGDGSAQDGFHVITENVPCGTTGATCSKAIKIFLGSYELKLSDGNMEVIGKEQGQLPPFSIRQMGNYLVVDTDVSLVLLWDKGTSIFLRLSPEFKGRVCGLCGNFDDNALNDFTTRSQSVVGDVLEFGNSWKFSPSCPDAQAPRDPCTANPYRKSWAQKQCSIINSATFSACHAHVESARYYEACVSDACACDSGGDCECFCTAVAAYAQACHEAGVCVSWRTPDICPLFCDYYNPKGHCEWHYQPCGAPCLRTCRNPRGQYLHDVRGLEGCYPKCPSEAPIFDEDQMRCVASCPTPTPPLPCRIQGKSYRPGSVVPSEKNCHHCVCTESGVQCTYNSEACVCTYDGRRFRPREVIYHTTDGTGACIFAHCGANGTIERRVEDCNTTTPTPQTTFAFSTLIVVSSTLPPSTHPSLSEKTAHALSSAPATTPGTSPGPIPPTASAPPSSRPRCGEECQWSPWLDVSRPGWGTDSGDFDTLENLRTYGYRVCRAPRAVECRAESAPEVPLEALGQRVECSPTVGLTCYNRAQASGRCDNYQIRILCCFSRACPPSSTETTLHATLSTTETGPTPGPSRVTSVPTGSAGSSAPVTTLGPTTASMTSKTPGPGTSTTGKITPLTPSPKPVSTTVSTTTSVSTTTPGPSKGTSSEPTQVTCLQETCTWTKWIDGSYPGAGRNSGDFDSFQNLRSKGYKFCANPKNVECRAEVFPNTSLQALGQNLICDKNVGLICWNRDQLPPICYNYQIRILCCEMVDVCRTNATPPTTPGPTQTTTGETSTAWTTATFSSSTQHSTASSAHVPTRTRVTTRTTEQSPLGTTSCQPQCTWTKWFDEDFPSPGPHGGDFETYSNIVRRGEKICRQPEYISALECRAENHPDVGIQMLGQVVQCSPEVGLVCRNRDQKGKFRMCLNYEVRVLCCEPQKGCPVTRVTVSSTSSVSVTSQTGTTSHEATSSATTVQTTSSTAVPISSTTTVETTGPTTAPTTSTSTVETTSPTTAPTTSTTTVETTGPTTAPTTSTATVETTGPTTAPTTSTATVETTGPTTAPTTSTTTVETTGPTTARRTSTTTVETTGPTTAPTISTTTVETTGPTTARRTSTTTVETTGPTTARRTSTTTVETTGPTTARRTSTTTVETTGPTTAPTTSTTTVETTGPTTAPTTSATTVETTGPTTAATTSTTTVEKTGPTTAPTTSTTTVETTGPTTAPTTSTTTVETTGPTTAPTTSTTTVETTSPTTAPTTSTTFVSIPETTHSQPWTTSCQPQCTWTRWFDEDFPSPGPHGGDFETYSNIVRRGEKICRQPEYISALECRAENHPDVGIQMLGQVVQCSPEVGLVCRNRDQKGKFRMCLNYEVRMLCCEPQKGCPVTRVTVSSTSSVSVTSQTGTTFHEATSSATTVQTTSSTAVPISSTTTVETTGPTTAPTTSTTTVETTSPTTAPTTSTTTVETTGPTTAPTTSTTTVETTGPTTAPTTSTSTVETTGPTTAPTTSTATVETTGTTTAPTTSTTTVEATSPTTAPTTSTTTVETTSPTTARRTSTTTVETTGPTTAPTTSTTTVESTSPTAARRTSTTTVETTGPTTAPTTSTTFVSIPETTHSQPWTTSCQPQCTWTKWFDEDFPSPGPHGGDFETYSNIVRRGEKICRQPEYISALECRAENHPDVGIQTLGQVVQCSPEVGLVCRNRDQKGKFRMCLNYEVRVLCCEPQKGCPVSSVTPSPQPSLSPESTTPTVSLVTSPSSAAPSTSTCYCSVASRLYPAGSIIYQQTDLSGHCYYALCSLHCHVVRRTDHTCPTSTPPPAPATSTPVSSPSASVSVTQGGCPNAVPPRTKGETWAMPNCSEATCEGNGVITVRARQCPKRQKPTCANGYPAVIVAHPEDCCPSYECKCVCSRWGKPHYITFDGTYYTFLDNCTYVLVQQIVPVFGHFRVLIDTYFCDAEDGLPCLQSIIIEYQQDRIVLTRKPVGGVMTNEIIFNGEVVRPGFQKDGIFVSQIGIKMYVTIPALGVQVMFSGLIFSVELPFSKFANNTEGQCGTCTNDQKDECRLPGGAVVPSCSNMPGHWNVTHPGQPSCSRPPPTPTTVEPKKTSTSCLPSPICQLILSKVFKPCHSVIPPWPYYQACAFDQCHAPTVDTRCSSLELYAALCASLSVCIDWRGLTAHECPFTCPADKVYRPCGPSNPSYCYMNNSANTLALPEAIPITEGCFCPEDMTLFSSSSEVCVPANCSSCVGPDGEPVEPGHTVSVGCQECTCKDGTWTLSCQTRPCAPPPACPEPGFVPVPAALQTGQCCPQYTCVCNTTHCPVPVDCPEGSRSILAYKEGACCPTQNCSRTVCSINGTLYQPGTIVSSNLCEKCWCELPGGPQSDTVVISCETQICSTHCPVGFEYQTQSGQCCGECVQVACVMNTSNSSAHLFYPGESWSDPGSRCVTHKCEKQQDGLVVVTTKKACAPLGCPADKARLSEDGCCLSCPHPPAQNRSTCAVYHELQVLRQRGCSSVGPVRLTYCRGNCGDTTSMYSLEARAVEHRCRCCRELRASVRYVTLRCGDGSSQAFSYTEVQECGCVGLRCDSHGGSSRSGEVRGAEHSQEAGLRRWSRGAPAPRPLQ
ncbi:mucin-5AC [Orcinus orca]|uniref:mucin-5AC n=1 Tax=Orcinus orca TaxID=9733 RepID=UPI002111A2D1|nr:mucin-5AC [Orcinus orca]